MALGKQIRHYREGRKLTLEALAEKCGVEVGTISALETGATQRSHSARAAFARAHPCPATGQPAGACPGYVVDHIVPLCAGGPDTPANMQWQTIEDGKSKDREEVRQCRSRAP